MSQRAPILLSIAGITYTIAGYLCLRYWWTTGDFPTTGLLSTFAVAAVFWFSTLAFHTKVVGDGLQPHTHYFQATMGTLCLAIVEVSFANGWLT